jgi:tetratricopeptide (TPR) repeat protein
MSVRPLVDGAEARVRGAGRETRAGPSGPIRFARAPAGSVAGAAREAPSLRPGQLARLHLIGPLRLIDGEGRDRTPRSAVLQALLAILALSPQGTRMRSKLQDLLWSESDQEHGGQSLRTALSRLRRDLAQLPADLLETDSYAVRLDVSRLWIDVFEYTNAKSAAAFRGSYGGDLPDLLEGLNLRSGAEEFEDWMRQERSFWSERLEALLSEPAEPVLAPEPVGGMSALDARLLIGSAAEPARPPGVGLLPAVVASASPRAGFLGDAFLDSLATALRDFMLAEIYDYRDSGGSPAALNPGAGPPLLLRVKVYEEGERLVLCLLAYRAAEQRLLWSWKRELPNDDTQAASITFFANEALDRVCETILSASPDPESAATPYHALNTMFRLDTASLDAARAMLERAHEESGDTVHLGLLAYLNTFRVGEHWLSYDEHVRDETRDLVDAVFASNPFNSLTLATTGHAYGYVLHDHETAIDLLERSTRIDPSPAICWDHLALNYLYAGRVEDATRASETAIRLGSFSPFRFTYDTTMCMISTIRGDYATAVRFGERALARRPTFGAALRYTAVALGHLGDRPAAERLVRRIRDMAPDFSSDWVSNDRLAVADQQAKARLLIGLQKAGA